MQNAEFYREDSGETVSPRRIQRGGLWEFSGMALQAEAIGGEARAQRGEGTWQGAASSAFTALPYPPPFGCILCSSEGRGLYPRK